MSARPRSFALSLALSLACSATTLAPLASLAVASAVLLGCSKKAGAQTKTYSAKGTIKSFGPDKKFVNIAHEDIPGYMGAMTMSFEPKDAAQLDGLAAADKVTFSFSDDEGRRVLVSITKAP